MARNIFILCKTSRSKALQMTTLVEVLEFLRSLGFGAMFCGGLTGLVYCISHHTFTSKVSIKEVMVIAGLLGAWLHRVINGVINRFLNPITNSLSFYSKLLQLTWLQSRGLISNTDSEELLNDFTRGYILGLPSQPQLLPPSPETNSLTKFVPKP